MDNGITGILRLLDFLHQALSDSTGYLRMVVLDNASIYLILHGPELNDIERIFRTPGAELCLSTPSRPSRR